MKETHFCLKYSSDVRTAATPLFATTLAKCLRSRPRSSVKDERIRRAGEPEAKGGRRAGRRTTCTVWM